MMSVKKISVESAAKYKWGTNCDTFVLLQSPTLSVKQERMPPGSSEKLHYHALAQQFFYVLKGRAQFHVEGETLELHPNDGVHVRPKQAHFIQNAGTEVLEFLVISEPATESDRHEIT